MAATVQSINSGILVGVAHPVPEDVWVRYQVAGDFVGCNRIFCDECHSWIHHFANFRILARTLDARAQRRLYEAKSPTRVKILVPDSMSRVYACLCALDQTPTMRALRDLDIPNWRCAGHPKR